MEEQLLTKQVIIEAKDRKHEIVPVPEWGGNVCVAVMSGTERDAFEGALTQASVQRVPGGDIAVSTKLLRARLVALTVVDKTGNRVFADGDIDALNAKSSIVLERICNVAMRLNGITPESVEVASKNS